MKRMFRNSVSTLAVIVFLCGMTVNLSAKTTIPKVFGDNMVLQRNIAVPVWGWAVKGDKITVSFNNQTQTAIADDKGNWMVKLSAMKANKTPQIMTIAGTDKITYKNILVGDVWLCSGQSNMEFGVGGSLNVKQETAAANYPDIRLIKFRHAQKDIPQKNVIIQRNWSVCSPKTVRGFSAAAYFFARRLYKDLKIPIGLISSSWGGTRVEPWTAPCGFNSIPELQSIAKKVNATIPTTDEGNKAYKEYCAKLKTWLTEAESALDKKEMPPSAPQKPSVGESHQSPTKIFNAMIKPIIPYAIKGAIWYQGESNGGEGMSYYHKKKALIGGWRKLWNQGDFPFYYVQLANYRKSNSKNAAGGDGWAKLRDAQRCLLDYKNTGMATIIDIGEAGNIHPKNKKDVGERLALWALAKDYGKDIVYSGPLFKDIKIDGNKAVISFDCVGGGLIVGEKEGLNPTREVKDGKLKWFAISGKDKKWYWADAVIDGDTVVATSEKVSEPIAVRYAYAMNPEGCNLYNKEGLPASPFKTDK
jgi:sialate O-acetylesterase